MIEDSGQDGEIVPALARVRHARGGQRVGAHWAMRLARSATCGGVRCRLARMQRVDLDDEWSPLDDLVALHTADGAGELHRRLLCFGDGGGGGGGGGNKADAFEPWCLFHEVHVDEPDSAAATALLLLTDRRWRNATSRLFAGSRSPASCPMTSSTSWPGPSWPPGRRCTGRRPVTGSAGPPSCSTPPPTSSTWSGPRVLAIPTTDPWCSRGRSDLHYGDGRPLVPCDLTPPAGPRS